jgi:hypothetical protein
MAAETVLTAAVVVGAGISILSGLYTLWSFKKRDSARITLKRGTWTIETFEVTPAELEEIKNEINRVIERDVQQQGTKVTANVSH